MVQCNDCKKWSHMPCIGFTQQSDIPEFYQCYDCKGCTIDASGLEEIALMRRSLWLVWNEGMKSTEWLAEKLR